MPATSSEPEAAGAGRVRATQRGGAALTARLDIRRGEGVPTLLLLGYSIATGTSNVFLDIGTTTTFLTTYSAAQLPLVACHG